jgi:hypothetical protein
MNKVLIIVVLVFFKKINFFIYFGSFWYADFKNNFKKIKKYYFNTF